MLTAVLAAPVGLGFLLLVAGGSFGDAMAAELRLVRRRRRRLEVLRWPVGLALLVFAIAVLLDHAPRRRQPALSWLALGAGRRGAADHGRHRRAGGATSTSAAPSAASTARSAGIFALLLWSLLSSIALFYGAAVCAQLEFLRAGQRAPGARRPGPAAEPRRGRLSGVTTPRVLELLHWNDVHGRFDALARLSARARQIRETADHPVLLLDGGDVEETSVPAVGADLRGGRLADARRGRRRRGGAPATAGCSATGRTCSRATRPALGLAPAGLRPRARRRDAGRRRYPPGCSRPATSGSGVIGITDYYPQYDDFGLTERGRVTAVRREATGCGGTAPTSWCCSATPASTTTGA